MKNNKLLKILINFGLSDNEANVYLSSLSLGPTTILKISKATSMKRTTIYSVVESLKQKGLMNMELKGWKRLFVAENPEKLNNILKAKQEELKNNLPQLLAMYNLKGSEGFIKYYEGLEAIKSVYENLLEDIKAHDYYYVVCDTKQWLALDQKYFLNFIKRRAKYNIKIRLLLQDSKIAREHKKMEKIFNEKIKFLPQGTSLTTDLIVIPKRVVIHQLTQPTIAMVIENNSIIQMHRELFELIWKTIR